VACRQLHAKCPQLFSAKDLEVQEAYELLGVVRASLHDARASGSSSDMVRLSHLVQRPLRTLERNAARVDLAEAAARLRAVGACKGLVALCTRMARARDPQDEALRPQDPSSARAQQLHYLRVECYQVVLEIFEDLYMLARQHTGDMGLGSGMASSSRGLASNAMSAASGVSLNELPELLPMPISPSSAMSYLDALLRLCLEDRVHGADELFHFCILKWMMQRELPVYRYDSPYLKGFLERHAREQPELLCRYFQHRGRWAEACDAYMALVRRSATGAGAQISRRDRLVLLQSAAMCARMPGSNRPVEPILRAIAEASGGEDTAAREMSSPLAQVARNAF